jgi:hypothetical protein
MKGPTDGVAVSAKKKRGGFRGGKVAARRRLILKQWAAQRWAGNVVRVDSAIRRLREALKPF